MPQTDSLDKIVGTYFAAFTMISFSYKNKTYEPKQLRVSPLIARGLICPPSCAGCCPKFSLDYLPFEDLPYKIPLREVIINGRSFIIHSDMQNPGWHCKNVIQKTGRCRIHGKQPFSCDFEIVRMKHFNEIGSPNQVLTAPFGRAWALLRIDGERGALCEIVPVDHTQAIEAARKFKRLAKWMEFFAIPHKVDPVVAYLEKHQYETNQPIII